MRWLAAISILTTAASCASSGSAPATKPPNEDLIVGEFERHPPDGTTVANFKSDGTLEIAHDRASLGSHDLATGTFDLKGDAMTLTYTGGEMCQGSGPGHYKVVISKIGIRFTKVDDPCDQRSKLDGQTWFRFK